MTRTSPIFSFVLLLAVLMKSMVPAGFMPDFSHRGQANGLFSMVICSGTEMKTILVDHQGNPAAPGDTQDNPLKPDGKSCAFATVLAQTTTPSDPVLALVDTPFVANKIFSPPRLGRETALTAAYSAQAPPTLIQI